MPEHEWKKLREPTWAAWAELPEVKDWPSARWRAKGVLPSPPDSAVHDGLMGVVLRWCLEAPTGNGAGPYDPKPVIRKLAEEGLTEVEDFKKQRPAAAKSIAGPLRTYAKILCDLRDHPEHACE